MKIKGEEFIPLKDVISVGYSPINEYCFTKMGQAAAKIGVLINEETLKKWINQAIYIESFNPEDIRDAATRDMVYSLRKENKKLKQIVEGINLLKLNVDNIEDYFIVDRKDVPIGCIPSSILAIVELENTKASLKNLNNKIGCLYIEDVEELIDNQINKLKEK